jgi:energy-converting hydrogenase Eha subunit C
VNGVLDLWAILACRIAVICARQPCFWLAALALLLFSPLCAALATRFMLSETSRRCDPIFSMLILRVVKVHMFP